jgi:Trk-type K+ transport system membrane component
MIPSRPSYKRDAYRFFHRFKSYRNFHAVYFTLVVLAGSVLLLAEPEIDNYWDALFMSASATCVTGLVSVDFSKFQPASKVLIAFLILLGSQVGLSIIPVLIRQRHYRRRVRKRKHTNTRLVFPHKVRLLSFPARSSSSPQWSLKCCPLSHKQVTR